MKRYVTKKSLAPRVKRITYSVLEKKNAENIFNMNTSTSLATASLDSTTWKIYSITNQISQGTTSASRMGNKIFVKYIQLSINFVNDGDNNLNGSTCRYGVWIDKNKAATHPSATDMFASGTDSATPAYNSCKNFVNRTRFQTKLDRAHLFVTTARSGSTSTDFTFLPGGVVQHYIPINKWVSYNGTGSTFLHTNSDNMAGNNIILAICASAANCCVVNVFYRVVFFDA